MIMRAFSRNSLRKELEQALKNFLNDEEEGTDKCIDEILEIVGKKIEKIADEVMQEPANPKDTRDYYYYRGQVSMIGTIQGVLE